jgi:prophage regulatory protein
MRLLRIHEVTRLTGLSRSSVYKQVRLKNFPDGVKITDRSTAWSSSEIENWIAGRLEGRVAKQPNAVDVDRVDNHSDWEAGHE